MNLNKLYIDHAIKWGLIQFIVGGIFFYAMYFIDLKFAVTTGRWLTIPISLAILVVQGLQARRFNGGKLTYGDAFKTLFIASVVSSALLLTTDYVIKNFISPSIAEEEKIVNIQETAKRMEKWGMDEEKVDETVSKMETTDARPSIVRTLLGLLGALIFSSILALIIAIFVKKKGKEPLVIIDEETT